MSRVDLSSARVTLVSALVWRAIAELSRRHAGRYQFRLVQFHPGASVRGVIRMELFEPSSQRPATWAEFNLGGPSGTYSVASGEGRTTLAALLGERPSAAIDVIEADLMLPPQTGALRPSSRQAISLRLLASLLERRVFDTTPWRASLAIWDWNGGSRVEPWHSRVLGQDLSTPEGRELTSVDRARLSDLVLLHANAPGDGDDAKAFAEMPALAVDLATGQLTVLTTQGERPLGEGRALYRVHGRSMRALADAVECELPG